MRIGMLIDTFLPATGGAEIHVLELARGLRNKGHTIHICTASAGDPIIDGFPVRRIPRLSRGGRKAAAYSLLALEPIFGFAQSVDVVHCHYTFLMTAIGSPIARLLKKPTVVTLHGLGTLDSSVRRLMIRRLARRLSFQFCSRVIATSDEMRQVALRYVPRDRVTIIPNGVDTDKFIPLRNDGSHKGPVILAMRRLAAKNGVQYLVEAAPYVLKEFPDAQFWIAGSGKLEDYLRGRASELGLGNNVRFLGTVPHDRTAEFYAQADIVAFPSSAESTSLACLEAMAMGKAVIASALSAYRELVGEDERGILVPLFDRDSSDYDAPLTLPPERIQQLAQGLSSLAGNEQLRIELGGKARSFVKENYDWAGIADRVMRVYADAQAR